MPATVTAARSWTFAHPGGVWVLPGTLGETVRVGALLSPMPGRILPWNLGGYLTLPGQAIVEIWGVFRGPAGRFRHLPPPVEFRQRRVVWVTAHAKGPQRAIPRWALTHQRGLVSLAPQAHFPDQLHARPSASKAEGKEQAPAAFVRPSVKGSLTTAARHLVGRSNAPEAPGTYGLKWREHGQHFPFSKRAHLCVRCQGH